MSGSVKMLPTMNSDGIMLGAGRSCGEDQVRADGHFAGREHVDDRAGLAAGQRLSRGVGEADVSDVEIVRLERGGQLVDVAHVRVRAGQRTSRLHAPAHAGQRVHQYVPRALLDRELTQLAVFLVLGQRVRGAQQPLQQAGASQRPHGRDSDCERIAITPEPAVRLGAKPVERHVAVHTADRGQLEICASSSVVALVQMPTSIPASRNARTTSKKPGWMVGSPPVSVTRWTRQSVSLGITVLSMSTNGMKAPRGVADTKQWAHRRLQRSSICTSAFR